MCVCALMSVYSAQPYFGTVSLEIAETLEIRQAHHAHVLLLSRLPIGCLADWSCLDLQMGMKFLTGHINLINMSLPVKMFEPRSYLEKLTDVWVYPALLTKAASCTDPVERMRWTVTWSALSPPPPPWAREATLVLPS